MAAAETCLGLGCDRRAGSEQPGGGEGPHAGIQLAHEHPEAHCGHRQPRPTAPSDARGSRPAGPARAAASSPASAPPRAHCGIADLEATGMALRLSTIAHRISAGLAPVTVAAEAMDQKACHPGGHHMIMRVTFDRAARRLPGTQRYGHRHARAVLGTPTEWPVRPGPGDPAALTVPELERRSTPVRASRRTQLTTPPRTTSSHRGCRRGDHPARRRRLVGRNVAALVKPPWGAAGGRPRASRWKRRRLCRSSRCRSA